jgi:hypothetical protein
MISPESRVRTLFISPDSTAALRRGACAPNPSNLVYVPQGWIVDGKCCYGQRSKAAKSSART